MKYGVRPAARGPLTAPENTYCGVLIGGGAGAVANFGTIAGGTGFGVTLAGGGSVTNGSATDTKAAISGAGGVFASGKLHGEEAGRSRERRAFFRSAGFQPASFRGP